MPQDLTLDYIMKKINYWKSCIKNDTTLCNYFNEILNVLNGHSTLNINLELNKYYNKNIKLIDELLRTGKYVYQVKFNKKAGRNMGFLVNKLNNEDFIEVFN